MMAMAVVAMFMLTAFSVALVDQDTDATGSGTSASPYAITIRVGDTFSYTPETNLAGTTIAAYNYTNSAWSEFTTTGGPGNLTWNGSVLSGNTAGNGGAFSQTGTYHVKLVASWSTGESPNTVSQTAEQYIDFEVVPVMTLGADDSLAFSQSAMPQNREIATVTATPTMAPSNPTIAWSVTQVDSSNNVVDLFELSSASGGSTTLKFQNKTINAGTYTVTVTAAETYKNLNFSDSIVYTITVGQATTAAAVVITTCIDDSVSAHYTNKTTSWTNGTGATWTVTAIGSAAAVGENDDDSTPGLSTNFTSLNAPTWTVDVSAANANTNYGFATNPNSVEAAYTNHVTYAATGYNPVGGDDTASYDVSIPVTYTVYAKLAFIGAPNMNGVSGYSNPVNPLDVLMSVNIEAAKKVVFNWGDGKSNTMDVSMYDTNVTMSHVYDYPGMYSVVVTAYNDFGNDSATYLYSAEAPMIMQAEKTFQVKDVKAVANEDANTLTLTPIVVTAIGSGTVLAYEWSYTMGEAKNVKITADNVSTLDFVINEGVPGASIILDTTKLDEKAKFTVKVTATFADDTETSKAISYNYSAEPVDIVKDYGLAILFAALFVISLVAILYFGFQTYWMYALAVVFAVLAVLMFVYHDFNGLIEAIKALFPSE